MKSAQVSFLYSIILLSSTPAADATQYVFFSDYGDVGVHAVARTELDGSGFTRVLYDSESYSPYVGELALDNDHQSLYYIGWFKIKRCNFDGSDPQTLIQTGRELGGLAIGGNKMYWTEIDRIRRANLDGSGAENVISNLGTCFSLSYDSVHNKLYYVGYEDGTWNKGGIFRADPDGSHVEKLVNNIGLAVGLAVDPYNGKMYWASRGAVYDSIKSAYLDGTAVVDLITGQQNPSVKGVQHLDIDLVGHKLYWADQSESGKVQRMNLDGTGYEIIHDGGAPYGIAVSLPEPATAVLIGLGGILLCRRSRKTGQ
jgi:hypothetical protein